MANCRCYLFFTLFAVVLIRTQFMLSSASTEVTKSEMVTQKDTSATSVKTSSSVLPVTPTQITRTMTFTKVPPTTFTRPRTDNGRLPDYIHVCPSNVKCSKLGGDCIDCDFNINCYHGRNVSVTCKPKWRVVCTGPANFTRWFKCRYCYQAPHWQHRCMNTTKCQVLQAPQQWYQANCTVTVDILCLGRRQFYKMLRCNWTSGKRWTTALALSITLGGFGADRFYLGLWREGIGKLFSFGGLGIWTLVDVVLVATGYVGPADGSLYIF